jgi:formylglycine-generating enzyme
MMAKRGAWAGALVALVGGCSTIAGLEKDYHLSASEGSSAGTGPSVEPGIPMLGGTCASPGALACQGHAQKLRLICGADETWEANTTCKQGEFCDTTPGANQGICRTALAGCEGKTSEDVVCAGADRMECGVDLLGGNKIDSCLAQSKICVGGACIVPPSCAKLPTTCGLAGNESCCATSVVSHGTYSRSNDPSSPYEATVSDFGLDRFEITVGRFRAFLNEYPGNMPQKGAGAHPSIANSGWNSAWNSLLPTGNALLAGAVMKCSEKMGEKTTWTAMPGANENLPMNCITWFEAFAFCAWDGGRLPTEAEWNYAAAGGMEQRKYPWGKTPEPDSTRATFCIKMGPMMCIPNLDILKGKVGSKPGGDGKWNQADLAGNVYEWNLDGYVDPYPMPCQNCANLPTLSSTFRVIRGGSWKSAVTTLPSFVRASRSPSTRDDDAGVRCARTP